MVVILLVAITGLGSTDMAARPTREYDLKAVFLYNLASFVDWPAEAFDDADTPFVIGVLGDDPFGEVLDAVVANEYLGKRPIVARRFRRAEDFSRCHVLFVSDSESGRVQDLLKRLRGLPVLTVGDTPDFVRSGGMVGFGRRGEHLELFVNGPAVKSSQLSVSSKLLEVARVIDPQVVQP